MGESRFYIIGKEDRPVQIPILPDALAAVRQGGYLWLDYCLPAKDDLSALIEPLGLHPLAVEDCLDESQIPKIEDYPGNSFILFNAFRYKPESAVINEVDFIIGRNFLVTVSGLDEKERPYMDGLMRQVQHEYENAREGPDFLAHILLDQIVDRKFAAIDALEDELDQAEDDILADHTRFRPEELVRLRRHVVAFRKSLFHEREVLVKICRRDCIFVSEKAIFYFRDIYDHLAKSFELTESLHDLVNSLMEMYLSTINNQMTRAANETNVIVRRLTFITTIFMPLTLLAGIGGMSEWTMMTGQANWRIAYPAFLLLMVVIGVGNYFFLKWLEKRSQPGR